MQYTEGYIGRIFILRLHDGDHLPIIIEDFAEKKNLSNALCFFLGGVKDKGRVVVGPKENCIPIDPMVMSLNGINEICAFGTIFKDEKGKPELHMHAALGRAEKTLVGCIRMGIDVWKVGEVVILEIKGASAYRKKDDKTGFHLLQTLGNQL
jgi:predicted DNA-binding protein with PD1-like motif